MCSEPRNIGHSITGTIQNPDKITSGTFEQLWPFENHTKIF
jgi:hypothetical protein